MGLRAMVAWRARTLVTELRLPWGAGGWEEEVWGCTERLKWDEGESTSRNGFQMTSAPWAHLRQAGNQWDAFPTSRPTKERLQLPPQRESETRGRPLATFGTIKRLNMKTHHTFLTLNFFYLGISFSAAQIVHFIQKMVCQCVGKESI